jgi:ribonuclease BN (tRNA processing enzyme)
LMELDVLGTGGGWARAKGAACGYLLRHDGFNLWLDAGTGTMANVQEFVALEDVHAVAVSHRHLDHFLDLYPFFLSLWWGTDRPSIPLFAPPGMFEHALQLESDLANAFALSEIEPGEGFEAGPFDVATAPMRHPVPTLGMRVQAGGQVLAYSADTGPTDDLVGLAKGADLLLAEATWLERPEGRDPVHLTAAEAGEHAARSDVARLVITHIWPTLDRQAMAERAAAHFDGPIAFAKEGMKVEL